MGMTIVRSFVEDEDERKVSGASVEVVAPGVEVLKHGDKTDVEGKITWTLRTYAVGAGEVFMTTCRASKDAVSVSEQFSLPANQPHDIFLVLRPKPSDPRTFRRIKTPTRFSKPPLNAFAALELDATRGEIKPVMLKNEGQAFNATKWEKANCVPIGKRDFIPVVDRKGAVGGWYKSGISADNLYSSDPRSSDRHVPAPETILYVPLKSMRVPGACMHKRGLTWQCSVFVRSAPAAAAATTSACCLTSGAIFFTCTKSLIMGTLNAAPVAFLCATRFGTRWNLSQD